MPTDRKLTLRKARTPEAAAQAKRASFVRLFVATDPTRNALPTVDLYGRAMRHDPEDVQRRLRESMSSDPGRVLARLVLQAAKRPTADAAQYDAKIEGERRLVLFTQVNRERLDAGRPTTDNSNLVITSPIIRPRT